jgi:ketosteroid isomerase-like protein
MLTVILPILMTHADATAQTARGNPAAAGEVKKMIALYRKAVINGDTTALRDIWTDDYTFTNAKGELLSKRDRLNNFGSGHTDIDSIGSDQDVHIRVHGDAAVATSTVTIVGKYSGIESSGLYRSIHVWIRTAGKWRLLANQITRVAK